MAYQVKLSKAATKQIKALPSKLQERIQSKIDGLGDNPSRDILPTLMLRIESGLLASQSGYCLGLHEL